MHDVLLFIPLEKITAKTSAFKLLVHHYTIVEWRHQYSCTDRHLRTWTTKPVPISHMVQMTSKKGWMMKCCHSKRPSLQKTFCWTETQTQVSEYECCTTQPGRRQQRQNPINWSETGVGKELREQGDSSTQPETYHMTEADGDWKVSQTLKHVVRCTRVSVGPACGSMTTRVYEYTNRCKINTFWILSNKDNWWLK